MAISVTNANRGTATEKTSDTTLTLTPSGNLASNSYGILYVVEDNSETTLGATTTLSVADDSGNGYVWTRDLERTRVVSAALDGVTCAIFSSSKLTAGLTTSHTITITNTSAATAKGAGLIEVAVGSGNTLAVSGSQGNQGIGTSTDYSVTVGSLSNIEHLWIAFSTAENELAACVTKDAAYTQACGGTIGSGTGGANTTNVIGDPCYLIETSTTQTYDNTGLTAADRAQGLVAYEEVTGTATESAQFHHADRSIYPGPGTD